MRFTFPRMIRGWFMEVPWWRGRAGIRIPASGLAAPICRGVQASESAGLEVLDGAGVTGDSTGITTTQCTTTAGTTPGAERFITGAVLREEGHAVDLTGLAAKLAGARMQGTDLAMGTPAHAGESRTILGRLPGPSKETRRQLEDTPHRAARAASAPAPTVGTTTAERQRAIPHAEAPVWERVGEEEGLVEAAVAEHRMEAADVVSPSLVFVPGGVKV
jgi:hypothetical protein